MTDISVVLSTIETIKSHCAALDLLRQQQMKAYDVEEAQLKRMATALNSEMRESYENYKKKYLGRIDNELSALMNLLEKDYSDVCRLAPENRSYYMSLDEDANRAALYQLIENINAHVAGLNNVQFDALVPPSRIDVNGEHFTVTNAAGSTKYTYTARSLTKRDDPKPLADQAKALAGLIKDARCCVAAISSCIDKRFDLEGFSKHVEDSNTKRLCELSDAHLDAYEKKFQALFLDEQASAVPQSFFTKLQEEGKASEVTASTVPTGYRESMTVGDLRMLVDNSDVHKAYFRNSPVLKKYMADGYLTTPLIMDLKKKGNLLLNIDEEVYSDETADFLNQLVMQFLLSFPANRINFCLVDIENHMNFSRFKSLTKINNGILMNGIVRDDRQLENTIKDMEQIMYKIDDDILSYNNVPNIFEYNKRYQANPQNVHLFVLVNYPSGMREDLAKRVSKILQSGNKAGIFCVIVNNKKCALSPSYKAAEHQQFLDTATKQSIVINKKGSRFTLAIPQENIFVPRNTISVDMLQNIIDNLKVEGDKKSKTVIQLDDMFTDTINALRSPRGIPSSAEVLDIPIGRRGGEIQNLLLKTSGDGSAHAVIIGGTGSGKSNLLHAIILSACYKYSPEELNLYIVDFKGGVEFEYYEANKIRENQIPHIKLTGLTSDLEDGVSILANLHKELRRREELFKHNQVEDICQYRERGKKMPRLFVIIDEIQELFEQDERLGQKAIDILRELFKKGRAFGINILWASQNVPKTPGLKDKVLSQIGNRISLRLNEPDDALDIKIDPKVVKNLNRPEKGLGVINDIRYGNDAVEFRVAYAESSVNRVKYSQMIIDKWRSVTEQMPVEPLYIVGDDAEPSPIGENTIYSVVPTAANVVSKAYEHYKLQLGQDYVTGKPFDIDLSMLENKQNLLMVGHDVEVLRDMMGYSLLSVVINQLTNADCRGKSTKIHCANGDVITPKNAGDLFNVLRDDFAPVLHNVSNATLLSNCIRDVYKVYKERAIEAENSEVAKAYAPEFVVIHSLQRYVDLISDNPMLRLKEDAAPAPVAPAVDTGSMSKLDAAMAMFASARSVPASTGSSSGSKASMPDSVTFCNALKELLDRGGKYNIHFIISVDDPLAIGSIKNELIGATYKVFVKGVSGNVLSQIMGDYKAANSLSNPKVAMVCQLDERTKVRMYRYDAEVDQGWYRQLCNNYSALMEGML